MAACWQLFSLESFSSYIHVHVTSSGSGRSWCAPVTCGRPDSWTRLGEGKVDICIFHPVKRAREEVKNWIPVWAVLVPLIGAKRSPDPGCIYAL